MKVELTGTITDISDKITHGDFYKRVVIIQKGDDSYAIEALTDKSDMLIKHQNVGDSVECSFYINSREYQGKWFTGLKLAYINTVSGAAIGSGPTASTSNVSSIINEVEDDLPF